MYILTNQCIHSRDDRFNCNICHLSAIASVGRSFLNIKHKQIGSASTNLDPFMLVSKYRNKNKLPIFVWLRSSFVGAAGDFDFSRHNFIDKVVVIKPTLFIK